MVSVKDGTSVVIRQCAITDWGSHCGLIQFHVGSRVDNIEGCLETCNFDGCNLATTNKRTNGVVLVMAVIVFFVLHR